MTVPADPREALARALEAEFREPGPGADGAPSAYQLAYEVAGRVQARLAARQDEPTGTRPPKPPRSHHDFDCAAYAAGGPCTCGFAADEARRGR